MTETTLDDLMHEIRLLREEQYCFTASVVSVVLTATGKDEDQIPDTVVKIMNKATDLAFVRSVR